MKLIKGYRKQGGVKELLILALPIIASQSAESFMIFTDRIYLSKLGSDQMNAATGAGVASFTLMTFFFGVIAFSTSLIAQYYGANKKDNCAIVTTQAFGLSIISYPIILTILPLAYWYFSVQDISESQLFFQKQYLNILVFGSIISLLRHSLSCFFSGIGKTKIVMVSALVTMTVNVIVNYILIYGKLGFPALGIEGAAYGTIFSAFCGMSVLAYYFFSEKYNLEFKVKQAFKFNKKIAIKLIRYGTPAGTEFFFNLIAFSFLIALFHSYNAETATAASITFNWDMVSFIPLVGIEIGVTSLVGRYIGAKKMHVAERSAYSGLKLGWFFSIFVFLVFMIFTGPLVDLFKPDDNDLVFNNARPLAINMLKLTSIYVLAEAILMAFVGALRGAGDTLWTMWVSMGLHWTFVPALYLSLYVFKIGPLYSWMVLTILFLFFCFVFFFRFKTGKWKTLKVIED